MSALMIALIQLLLKYGPEAYIAIVKSLDTNTPTVEEIQALIVKAPESYFEE